MNHLEHDPSDARALAPEQPPAPHDARIGARVLGGFTLQRALGEGAFARVYLATQDGTERYAVVKIAHEALMRSPQGETIRDRFAIEFRASTRVQHPNLATVYMVGETPQGLPAMAMAYVEGSTLAAHLERGKPLRWSALLQLWEQAAHALAAIHEANIIHRDVTPYNVMVSRGDGPLQLHFTLLDFGVAHLGDTSPARHELLGTPRYMAPEQLVGQARHASDIYSLGAILWWAITGHELLAHVTSLPSLFDHHARSTESPSARAVQPQLPEALDRLLRAMLSPSADDRPSARQLLSALHQLRDEGALPPSWWVTAAPRPLTPAADTRALNSAPTPIAARAPFARTNPGMGVGDQPSAPTSDADATHDDMLTLRPAPPVDRHEHDVTATLRDAPARAFGRRPNSSGHFVRPTSGEFTRPSSGEFARHPVALHTSPEADEVPAPRQTLLIWDDNPVLRELVRAQLSALRCDISWYETPSALISRASEGGWDALMLLSDRALDGSVTAQWLLNAAADDPRPLLVLTAQPEQLMARKGTRTLRAIPIEAITTLSEHVTKLLTPRSGATLTSLTPLPSATRREIIEGIIGHMPNWLSALQEACELRHAHAARLHCAQITEASRGIDAAQLGRLSELVAGLIRQEAWADALQMSDALEQEYTRVFRQLMILHHEP